MRITREQLQDLINEEISVALLKHENCRLTESPAVARNDIHQIEANALIEFAKAYRGLGNAIAEQLDQLLEDGDNADVNSNAVDIIEERLGGFNDEIDSVIESWKTLNSEDGSLVRDDE